MFWKKKPQTTLKRFDEILNLEKAYIEQRRIEAKTNQDFEGFEKRIQKIAKVGFSLKDNQIGLALSGGGIRSATFNLGFLQALAKYNVLKFCDYLSTVSGGGYIGCCLTSLLSKPEAGVNLDDFPFRFDRTKQQDERQEVTWLRRHGNYLIPNKRFFSIQTWSVIALLITGIIIINIPTFYFTTFLLYALDEIVNKLKNPDSFVLNSLIASGILIALMVLFRGLVSMVNVDRYEKYMSMRLLGVLAILSFFTLSASGLIFLASRLNSIESETSKLIQEVLNNSTIVTVLGLTAGFFNGSNEWSKKLINIILSIAQYALFPIVIANLVHFLWTGHVFNNSLWDVPIIIIFAFVLVLLSFKIDLNKISMHSFYRNQLSEAYIVCKDTDKGEGSIKSNDSLSLKDIHNGKNGAPYHLINATINLPSSKSRHLRGRGADFFLFSKYFCGCEATKYCPTEEYEGGSIKLSTAMAISGAAVSPQAGTNSGEKQAFLFTLLNLRLNRWMPNPNKARKSLFFYLPYYYMKELLRRGNEKDRFVNLSDGGHIENLGIYPLLKRKCALIIASDAGADPNGAFDDLANLLAKARIDLGIEITLDLKDIRQDPLTKTSTSVMAIGTISYTDKSQGILLYFKSTITGREPEDLLSYRKAYPIFPNQSTEDQFFDETQFESYRELGYFEGKSIFS